MISNKNLKDILSRQEITTYAGCTSFTTDEKELNFSASLENAKLVFSCAMWIGTDDEETVLTEEQKDIIYYTLLAVAEEEIVENDIDQEHALTLIYS